VRVALVVLAFVAIGIAAYCIVSGMSTTYRTY